VDEALVISMLRKVGLFFLFCVFNFYLVCFTGSSGEKTVWSHGQNSVYDFFGGIYVQRQRRQNIETMERRQWTAARG
jgi:hypothetical protein